MLILFLVACAPDRSSSENPPVEADSAGDTGGDSRGGTGDDTGGEELVFDESTDVIIVGTGPAGLAAAVTATEAGARVVILEQSDEVGRGARSGSRVYGAVTRFQEEVGLEDSLELAAQDWEEETGESGTQPSVATFIAASAGVLDWLAERGAIITAQADALGVDRHTHTVTWPTGGSAIDWVTAGHELDYRLATRVTEPLMQGGRVVGVVAQTAEGERRYGADAVILATGGFLRDLELVEEHRPELLALDPVFECNPGSTGAGIPFLEAVGADWHQPEQMAVYLHSIRDPRLGESEALLVIAGRRIVVGRDGHRFADESDLGSFDLVPAMPSDGAFMVVAWEDADPARLEPPGYNWAVTGVHEQYTFDEIVAAGSDELWPADTLEDAVAAAGLPPETLEEVEDYNDRCATAAPDEFGGTLAPGMALVGPEFAVVELRPGLAKNYGGVRTDVDTRVLDPDGQPIPGLYAAGEVAGMVPGGGTGTGFNGTVTAVWYGGRVAGAKAAEEAAAR